MIIIGTIDSEFRNNNVEFHTMLEECKEVINEVIHDKTADDSIIKLGFIINNFNKIDKKYIDNITSEEDLRKFYEIRDKTISLINVIINSFNKKMANLDKNCSKIIDDTKVDFNKLVNDIDIITNEIANEINKKSIENTGLKVGILCNNLSNINKTYVNFINTENELKNFDSIAYKAIKTINEYANFVNDNIVKLINDRGIDIKTDKNKSRRKYYCLTREELINKLIELETNNK